jgi:hypothetical protein
MTDKSLFFRCIRCFHHGQLRNLGSIETTQTVTIPWQSWGITQFIYEPSQQEGTRGENFVPIIPSADCHAKCDCLDEMLRRLRLIL